MARPIFAGFEAGEDLYGNAQGFTHGSNVLAPSRGAGRVYASNTAVFNSAPAGSLRSGYVQFRLKIERLPSNGDGKVLIYETRNGVSNPSGTPGILLNSSGQLEFLSYSTTSVTSIGTSSALSLRRWYLIEYFLAMNSATQTGAPGVETNAQLTVWIDRVQIIAYAPTSVPAQDGMHTTGGAFSSTFVGTNTLTGSASATNAIVCFDDLILDTVSRPANEHIVALHPSGLGTYSAWTNAVRGFVANMHSATGVTSSTAAQRVSYTVPTLRSLGVTGPTVGQARFLMSGSATGTDAQFFVIVNGVETALTANLAVPISFALPKSLDFTLTLLPDDVVEIGYQKDNTTNPRNFAFLYLNVSVPDASVTLPTLSADVEMGFLQYTGNGTANQTVTLPFEPDFILIVPVTGSTQRLPQSWDSSLQLCQHWTTTSLASAINFVVRRGAAQMVVTNATATQDLNLSATLYDVLVVRDPTRRMVERGDFTRPSSESNFPVVLATPTFPVRWLFVNSNSNSASSQGVHHGSSAVGDLTYRVGQSLGGEAGLIQSVGTGTFAVGSSSLIITSYFSPYVAFQDQTFRVLPLLEVVAWTGTGTSPRTITLVNTTRPVKAVLVIPIAGGTSVNGRRGHIRTPGFTGANSRYLSSTSDVVTTGITALATGSFSGPGDCNLSAQTYEALVFFDGLDPELIAVPSVVGLTLALATTAILAAGFVVGTTAGLGTVISQTPVAAALALPGSAINLVFDAPPVLVNPGPQDSVELLFDSLQLVATTINPHTLVYSASGLPPGLSVHPGTGLISGTPAAGSPGIYTVTVTVEGVTPTGNIMPATLPFTL